MPEWALGGGAALSGLLGGIFAPEGQEISSFEGGTTDPRTLARGIDEGLGDLLVLALNEARKPVNIDTTVAPLPIFSGGGLPFHITAPATDPARFTPSRRELSGTPDIPDDFAAALQTFRVPSGGGDRPPPPGDEGSPFPDYKDIPGDPRRRVVTPPTGGDDPDLIDRTQPNGDDLPVLGGPDGDVFGPYGGDVTAGADQAEGAIALLMQQIRSGGAPRG